jgi:intracellular sulfur oxidation DsrE/DsrF family protein
MARSMKPTDPILTRRNASAAAAALAALALGPAAVAQTKAAAPFAPARHDKDDWMDVPSKHRIIFDTTSADRFGDALLFATNFLTANRSDYGLQNSDIATIIVVRHLSTAFGYSEAVWAKYSAQIAPMSQLKDVPKTNPRIAGAFGIDALAQAGVKFAVCSMASQRVASTIAQAVGGKSDDIYNEITSSLAPNARMVPAGIIAINRAQERGYTLVTP